MNTTDTITRTNAVSLADENAVKEVLVQSVLGLWDVVNNLTRLKPSHRDRYRVTIFGSARANPEPLLMTKQKEPHMHWRKWAATSSPVADQIDASCQRRGRSRR